MDVVAAGVARAAINMARRAGLSVDELCRGLPSVRADRVAWVDYATFLERFEIAAGGPEASGELVARSYRESLPRDVRTVFGACASPKLLYRFIYKVVDPVVFPIATFGYEDLGKDVVRVLDRLRPGVRPSRPFHNASLGALRGMTGHLGLPMADLEVEELTESALVTLVHLPPSRTILALGRRAAVGGAFVRFLEAYGSPPKPPPAPERAEALRHELDLTDRQVEVLRLLAAGRSNKEIASSLDCAEKTVQFHIKQLFRKAGVDGRALLIARYWGGDDRGHP